MSSVVSGVWRQPQNTKIPSITHLFSVRVPITANTTSTYQIPANTSNPVQLSPTQAPLNYSSAQNPSLPNNKPQQGLRFFVTDMAVRDTGTALAGSGATTGATVALVDVTQSNIVVASIPFSAGAFVPYVRGTVQFGTASINPYDQLAITFTAQTGGTPSTSIGFTVDVFGYFQQAV